MRLLTYITLGILTTTLSYGKTTMCFKENHNSMSTIESTKLDGGECKGLYTLNQMKKNGWEVDDIKITTKDDKYSFIYIFKDKTKTASISSVSSTLNDAELEAKIIKRIEAKKIQKIKEEKIEKELKAKINGKEVYVGLCQSCHGKMGETEAMNTSRPLNSLSYEQMQDSIDLYLNDNDFDKGRAIVMRPYAANVSDNELENISNYIKSINK